MTRNTWKCGLVAAVTLVVATPVSAATTVRVASLVPFVSEALVAVAPTKALLVASTRSEGRVLPAGAIDLGDGHAPDFEQLASADAAVLVADRRWHTRHAERARELGLEIFWVEADSVDDTLAVLEQFAVKLGFGPEMAVATAAARAQLAGLTLARKQRVLLVFGAPGSFLVGTPRTWLGDLITRLGGELAAMPAGSFAAAFPGYVPMSDEVLATVSVDAVVLVAHGDPALIESAFAREWARLRGDGRVPVVALDPALFGVNPGLGLDGAAASLVGRLDAVR